MSPAPHATASEPITIRRGMFWIPGDLVEVDGLTAQRGPMWVEWEAPAGATRPLPLVLVHGGGGQGTDWKTTPDGRPGWSDLLVKAGYAVYIVDRPGHGRSPHHPGVLGEPGPQFTYEWARRVFAPDDVPEHTEWPWGRRAGDAVFDQFMASGGFLLRDVAQAQELDAARLASLLDLIGPAILITHSAGAPAGWLTAALRPGSVRAIIAIEPQSPPFASRSGNGDLVWGITAAPIAYDPPAAAPEDLARPVPGRRIAGLDGIPVLLVTGAASPFFRGTAPHMVDFLRDVGADARWLDLADAGLRGNGHGIMLERNSDSTVVPLLSWLSGLAAS